MTFFSSSAVLIRRIPHGDYDMIATFFSEKKGKVTLIAKNAKKSRKRFAGMLEPFSRLQLVCTFTKGRSLGVLQEASIEQPFPAIRGNVIKTAYASYWGEIIYIWCEEGKAQPELFRLFSYCLGLLDSDEISDAFASIIFQMRFLFLSGLAPHLTSCAACKKNLDALARERLIFELAKGGLVCQGCSSNVSAKHAVTRGLVKQLLWIQENELEKLKRLKFNRSAVEEGLKVLEAFVPYHLGKEPRSLRVLKSIREAGQGQRTAG
jgi:DNA repair protein RecO (recombination protein O)